MAFVTRKARVLEAGIRRIENVISVIGMVMLMALMLLGASDVVGRYVFNHPITGAVEISEVLMGMVVFLAWGYTMARREHISVDILFNHYPPRVQTIASFVMLLLTLVLFSLIVWQAGTKAMLDWEQGRLLKMIPIPVAPFKLLVPFGAFFLCLECIIQMIQLVPKMKERSKS